MERKVLFDALVELGGWLRGDRPGEGVNDEALLQRAKGANAWFTPDSVRTAMKAHGEALRSESLEEWWGRYTNDLTLADALPPKTVGLVLAGNLPMVGWHDVLSVLSSGNKVLAKCSRDDAVLLPAVIEFLAGIAPEISERTRFVQGPMSSLDAVIATGSNNSMRYFRQYFNEIPHLFRGQRTGVAFLDGEESDEDTESIARDVFTHFGLGCRSTTKLMLPKDFDLNRLFRTWVKWSHLAEHNKFANNYDYHKAIWLLNNEALVENGFLLVKEDEALVSPVGTLFVERYEDGETAQKGLRALRSSIQCVSCRAEKAEALAQSLEIPVVPFGEAQSPRLWDYADGEDTMDFLLSLSRE